MVVHADADRRIDRLVRQRGMTEADARSRVAAQADDQARRAVADVWLDNSGAPDELSRPGGRAVAGPAGAVRGEPADGPARRARLHSEVPADPRWAADGARLAARVAAAAGSRGRSVEHIGRTAVPGLPAADVIELQLGVAEPAEVAAVEPALAAAGFPPSGSAGEHWSADPGRSARVVVRPIDSAEWRDALRTRDRLRSGWAGAQPRNGLRHPGDRSGDR